MKEKEVRVDKKKKITRNVIRQLHLLFDSGINGSSDGVYRKVTYLFDGDKFWVGTNTPKRYDGYKLMGLFYFKHINKDG